MRPLRGSGRWRTSKTMSMLAGYLQKAAEAIQLLGRTASPRGDAGSRANPQDGLRRRPLRASHQSLQQHVKYEIDIMFCTNIGNICKYPESTGISLSPGASRRPSSRRFAQSRYFQASRFSSHLLQPSQAHGLFIGIDDRMARKGPEDRKRLI